MQLRPSELRPSELGRPERRRSERPRRPAGALLGLVVIASLSALPWLVWADGPFQLNLDTLFYTDTDNVTVVTPQLGARYFWGPDHSHGSVGARALVDVVSAASVDVLSHATTRFTEARTEASFDISHAFGEHLPSASYRFSIEPDYESHGLTLGLQSELGTSDSVLRVSYSGIYDQVGRQGTPRSAFARELFTHNAEVGLTQVLGPDTLLRGVYSLTIQDGYMEKPYRFVPLFDATTLQSLAASGQRLGFDNFGSYSLSSRPPEEVPDLRVRHAMGLRLLQSLAPDVASMRMDYQLYFDDWGITAHTAEAALRLQPDPAFRLTAYGRFYIQSAATFWRRTYSVQSSGQIPRYRSLDRELSDYYNLGGGLRAEVRVDSFGFYLDGSVMYSDFQSFLLLEERVAVMAQGGIRWAP